MGLSLFCFFFGTHFIVFLCVKLRYLHIYVYFHSDKTSDWEPVAEKLQRRKISIAPLQFFLIFLFLFIFQIYTYNPSIVSDHNSLILRSNALKSTQSSRVQQKRHFLQPWHPLPYSIFWFILKSQIYWLIEEEKWK